PAVPPSHPEVDGTARGAGEGQGRTAGPGEDQDGPGPERQEAGHEMSAKAQLTGTVVSDKMNQTVVVSVERQERHEVYGKGGRRQASLAPDATTAARGGDRVAVAGRGPRSRRKRWIVTRVVQKAQEV